MDIVWQRADTEGTAGCVDTMAPRRLHTVLELPRTFDWQDIQRLEYLADMGLHEAHQLIKLIHNHRRVELWGEI